MTEPHTAPPVPAAPQQPPAAPGEQDDGPGRTGWDTAGTIIMCVSVAGLAVILLDVAMKGRLLGPLLARLAPAGPPPGDTQPPAGPPPPED